MAASGQIFVLRESACGRAALPHLVPGERRPPRPWPDTMVVDHAAGRDAAQRTQMTAFVETQVVPRLSLPRLQSVVAPAPHTDSAALAESVAAFVPLLLQRSIDEALTFMIAAHDRGHSFQALYLGLLTSTARHCGALWEDDLMSFSDVSIVSARLHQLLHITGGDDLERPYCGAGRDIMLLAQPGAQHMLGLSMVRTFFRKAGWRVCMAAPNGARELAVIMRENWFAVAGFAVTLPEQIGAVRAGIDAVRRVSRNRRIGIMVGGPVLVEHPEYASELGADSLAFDGEAAVKQAEDLLVVPARNV